MFQDERLRRWWDGLSEYERFELRCEVDAEPISAEAAEIVGRLTGRGPTIIYAGGGWQRVMPWRVREFVRSQ